MILYTGLTKVNAQDYIQEIRPGVNVEQFFSAVSSDVSLQTGQVSVNIPLFNLEGKGMNVPITLVFNGGGITHESEASSVGLGWSLLAGGVISQTVRDLNDLRTGGGDRIPWQYQSTYVIDKMLEEMDDIYDYNKFDGAMSSVIGGDGEPDVFKYSFLGFSGDICFKYDDTVLNGTLYPDKSFLIAKITDGFKIIADDGAEYLFEEADYKSDHSTGWFLTEINTVQGGNFKFHYVEDNTYDLTYPTSSAMFAGSYSKRLERIDFDYGHVNFYATSREDKSWPDSDSTKLSKRINRIELYNKQGALIKGYELDNNSYITNENSLDSWHDKRLKLNSIREYNSEGEYLPPYEFEYDYSFFLSKSSRRHDIGNMVRNTWAHNPISLASVDRNSEGTPAPWVEWMEYPTPEDPQPYPVYHGFSTTTDPIDGFSIQDYLCLTKISFPAGGSESYYYESHDYSLVSHSGDTLKPPYNNFQFKIKGKRLWKKKMVDEWGKGRTILYRYCLHDENHQPIDDGYFQGPRLISSGVLSNPSIHTSTLYKPDFHQSNFKLEAFPHYTPKPQNSLSGSPVYYTQVEELHMSDSGEINGKKIYYFDRIAAIPATNYVYLNYRLDGSYFIRNNRLISIPNTLNGKQQYATLDEDLIGLSENNYTYLAYPVGKFYEDHLMMGKILMEVVLDSDGNLIKKVENSYRDLPWDRLNGLVVERINDTGDNDGPINWTPYRYLISQSQMHFRTIQLTKRRTTYFYQSDSVFEDKRFHYTSLNLLKSDTLTLSNGKEFITERVYPGEVEFLTTSNLSSEAASLIKMRDLNMIRIPVQVTSKIGEEFVEGSYTSFKELSNGAIVIDTLFKLAPQMGASIVKPIVNSNGKLIKSNNYEWEKAFLSYDENVNPTTIGKNDGTSETYIWGHGNQYPIARIENYTYDQVNNNSALVYQLSILDDYTIITDMNRDSFKNCNQLIRNTLPDDVKIITYTYNPLIGITTQTDANGITTYYEYDDYGRLETVLDANEHVLQHYKYHYKE